MQDWIVGLVASYGYLGVFLMITLETVFPPIPSEAILLFGGFMAAVTSMNIPGVVSAATAGSLLGAAVLYLLGRFVGKARIDALVDRWGRFLRLEARDVDRAVNWFDRYQGKTVFLCRMVPLLRSLISIPAGIAGMPFGRFTLLTCLGSLVWNTVLVCTGYLLGEQWDSILYYFGLYSTGVYMLCIIILIVSGIFMLMHRKRTSQR